ncbi:MAG TPA: glutaredoxin family protein [Candidatus Saccharimonadales bacterium]|nr:glutaredoxin family protein [Candidatus Saccharimonadales bacterium]
MTKVKIYTTQTCPYCKMEKEYLDSKGIEYENIFIDEDREAAEELMKMEGQFGVPFTIFTKEDGTKESLLGFDKEEINRILALN